MRVRPIEKESERGVSGTPLAVRQKEAPPPHKQDSTSFGICQVGLWCANSVGHAPILLHNCGICVKDGRKSHIPELEEVPLTGEVLGTVTTLPAKAGSFPEHARRDRPRYALAAPSGPG